MPLAITLTMAKLWTTYAGSKTSGRVPCPIATPNGVVTHLYRGYGVIRLEAISDVLPIKGFQGTCILQGRPWDLVWIYD